MAAADTSRRKFTPFCPALPGRQADCYEAVVASMRDVAGAGVSGVLLQDKS